MKILPSAGRPNALKILKLCFLQILFGYSQAKNDHTLTLIKIKTKPKPNNSLLSRKILSWIHTNCFFENMALS